MRALRDLAPGALPAGVEVGPWRVLERRGRGTYGAVYRVERLDGTSTESFALKLATHPMDPRFEREAELLSRIRHPGVPRLHGHGLWPHPAGPFPFLVMDWVEGVPLYEWCRASRPTSRQVLRLLAQVARALEATHAADCVHRDVKGDNVLVRVEDGHAILADFGAGDFRGARTLTETPLPPGTPPYRSPEALRFQWNWRSHPAAHYEAGPADDVYALGVTAYRLVTGTYPPPPRMPEAAGDGGDFPAPARVPPRHHDAAVCEELDDLIQCMLAESPEERFGGSARKLAEALESAAEGMGPEADVGLSAVAEPGPPPDWEARAPAECAGQREESLRERGAHALWKRAGPREVLPRGRKAQAPPEREVEAGSRAWEAQDSPERVLERESPPRSAMASHGWPWLITAASMALSLLSATARWPAHRPWDAHPVEGAASGDEEERDAGTVAVGDSAVAAQVSIVAPVPSMEVPPSLGLPMPERPFPGQRKPPCTRKNEVEIRGGCWFELRAGPPCGDAYEHKGACYVPIMSGSRPNTSGPASDGD